MKRSQRLLIHIGLLDFDGSVTLWLWSGLGSRPANLVSVRWPDSLSSVPSYALVKVWTQFASRELRVGAVARLFLFGSLIRSG